jgi:hypothetical protein
MHEALFIELARGYSFERMIFGLYYKHITIVIDAVSVVSK